jgi:hypothetical protein
MHPHISWQCRICKTEGAVSGGGKNSIIDKRIEIDKEYLQIIEMNLIMVVLLIFPKNPFIAEKAQFSKVIDTAAVFLIVVIYISLVVRFVKTGFDAVFLV